MASHGARRRRFVPARDRRPRHVRQHTSEARTSTCGSMFSLRRMRLHLSSPATDDAVVVTSNACFSRARPLDSARWSQRMESGSNCNSRARHPHRTRGVWMDGRSSDRPSLPRLRGESRLRDPDHSRRRVTLEWCVTSSARRSSQCVVYACTDRWVIDLNDGHSLGARHDGDDGLGARGRRLARGQLGHELSHAGLGDRRTRHDRTREDYTTHTRCRTERSRSVTCACEWVCDWVGDGAAELGAFACRSFAHARRDARPWRVIHRALHPPMR
jgi:hypothetical protein